MPKYQMNQFNHGVPDPLKKDQEVLYQTRVKCPKISREVAAGIIEKETTVQTFLMML
jgi:hypothetical protein